jgi:hypothetical protein
MKIGLLVAVLMLSMGPSTTAFGQSVEMAAKCDDAQRQLTDLVRKPDSTDTRKIKEALGLDVLVSCATAEGQIICYQCMDKDQNLRTLQLLQKSDTKRFELLGFGCRCREIK